MGFELKTNDVKALNTDRVAPFLEQNEDLALAGKISKESIDFLTRQIKAVENVIEEKDGAARTLQKAPHLAGIGKTLGLTIMLETGPISRFAQVGNYCSYCRKVSTKWISNDKKKGKGNKKSGNKYLAWAFSEAAEIARRYYTRGPGILPTQDAKNQRHDSASSPYHTNWREQRITLCEMECPLCRRRIFT